MVHYFENILNPSCRDFCPLNIAVRQSPTSLLDPGIVLDLFFVFKNPWASLPLVVAALCAMFWKLSRKEANASSVDLIWLSSLVLWVMKSVTAGWRLCKVILCNFDQLFPIKLLLVIYNHCDKVNSKTYRILYHGYINFNFFTSLNFKIKL